jgi:hypothetical protein
LGRNVNRIGRNEQTLKTNQEIIQSQHIQIRREIFHGDCLSPLLFYIGLNALRHELNSADCGYQVQRSERKISQLLYVDGWKLLGRNENGLENEIKIVNVISTDINMKFGI